MHDDLETAKLDELTLAVKNCKVFNFPIQMLRNYIKEVPFQALEISLNQTSIYIYPFYVVIRMLRFVLF